MSIESPSEDPADNGLVKVTLNLTPRTQASVARLRRQGGSQTDVINRSVQLASLLDEYIDPATGRLTLLDANGERVHVHLVG